MIKSKTTKKAPEQINIDALIYKWAAAYGLEPKLIKAICSVESNFNPNAIGDYGESFGLMQIQPATAAAYVSFSDPSELLNPDLNIQAGCAFLDFLISRYGYIGGIQAYNLGETKYRKGLKSLAYLGRVQDTMKQITIGA